MAEIVGIEQKILAGSDFDGSFPTTDPTEVDNQRLYPADTAGGRIDLPDRAYHLVLKQLEIKFGGQTAWSLVITDGTTDVAVLNGTNETDVVSNDYFELPLGYWMKLTTTGASSAMTLRYRFDRSNLA